MQDLVHVGATHVEKLSGWGRLGVPASVWEGEDLEALSLGAVLFRGLGRSYGDASLPARRDDCLVATHRAAKLLSFDPETGVVRAQAGMSLAELNRWSLPLGWFTPVTPGTQFVTLGGMVASDVHGGEHHRKGCFGAHVRGLKLRVADGALVECGPGLEEDLFLATQGGMGLTGHILEVEFPLERVPSRWIAMESRRVKHAEEFLETLADSAATWPMTKGWMDCLQRGRGQGRGILYVGRWAEEGEAPAVAPREAWTFRVPWECPNALLNPLTAKLFNACYYAWAGRARRACVAPDEFLYPLDALQDWNLLYGPRGFTQYQCVLPRREGPRAVQAFLSRVTKSGAASPLCVIKDCGPEGRGLLSFPMEGTSLAIDLPVSADTPRLVADLNAFVKEVGGRIYLSKDAFTTAADFRAMEPRLERFLTVRARWDPQRRLRSALSVRLFGDPA